MIHFGCAWYPEHWPASRWPHDLQLMRDAGMTVVRIGEFAWSRMEPAEGQFTLDWLAEAVDLAAKYGMAVVIGTPTAAPPAWLTQRYPETLATRADGQRATHGARCHYSPGSEVYKQFCRRIAETMAKCVGHHPQVIGWQIDNEYNSVSYDAETRQKFQQWLKARFGSLEALAEHWATAYWSEDYSDWSQIPLPVGNHNPGLLLAFQQFITDVYIDFQRVQIEAIRAHSASSQWITHNFMKWFDTYDHYRLAADLDLASWDNYVPTGHLDHLENGAMHDLMRGIKRANFWIMETQPGQVNWGRINNMLDRGEVRTMGWHAIGHGADALLYWQWRNPPNGQEQMHGSLLASDGTPRPIYREIAQIGQELKKIGPSLESTSVQTPIALLHSYEDRWSINFQRHHQDFDPVKHLLNYYRPLRRLGHSVDVVSPLAPLANYKLVIAPNLGIADETISKPLISYVQNGGHLVLGPRSGVRDGSNALLPTRQPGPFAPYLGAHVEEYYALERPVPVAGSLGNGAASIWAEELKIDARDAEAYLHYGVSNGWLDGNAALVTRKVGTGRITYIGAWLDDGLMTEVTRWLLAATNLPSAWENLPEGVELCERSNAQGGRVYILINHTHESHNVTLPVPCVDVVGGQAHPQYINLPALDIAVLQAMPNR